MSRHTIPIPAGSPETWEITVGWDAPMNTFFGMCLDSAAVEPLNEVFWVGDSPCKLPTIGHLATALREHGVELPIETARALAEDHTGEGERFAGRPATALLAAMSHTYAGPEQQARISAALTGQDQRGGAE